MIPPTDIGEGDLHAEIRLDELCELPQAVAKTALGIVRARSWHVLAGVSGLEHLYRVESLFARAMQDAVRGAIVHRLEGAGCGRGLGIPAAHGKVGDVVHRDGGFGPAEDSRQ